MKLSFRKKKKKKVQPLTKDQLFQRLRFCLENKICFVTKLPLKDDSSVYLAELDYNVPVLPKFAVIKQL